MVGGGVERHFSVPLWAEDWSLGPSSTISQSFLTWLDFVKLCLNWFDLVQITQLCTNFVLVFDSVRF